MSIASSTKSRPFIDLKFHVIRLYSEIDQTYLSIEAQCVSHYYPRWTATVPFSPKAQDKGCVFSHQNARETFVDIWTTLLATVPFPEPVSPKKTPPWSNFRAPHANFRAPCALIRRKWGYISLQGLFFFTEKYIGMLTLFSKCIRWDRTLSKVLNTHFLK